MYYYVDPFKSELEIQRLLLRLSAESHSIIICQSSQLLRTTPYVTSLKTRFGEMRA